MDVSDGAAACSKVAPQAWHEIGDDIVVCRHREIEDGCIRAREMVLSKTKGIVRDRTYSIRLYSTGALAALTARAGFDDIRIHTDTSALAPGVDVGCMNHRLVVAARKP